MSRQALIVAAVFLVAGPAHAQGTGDGFLFKRPIGTVTVRSGFDRATAGSDLFSFVTDELTVNRRDFSGFTLAADLAFRIKPRLDGVFSLGYSRSRTPSEFRHWVDNNDQPITQTTTFTRVPVTASLKAYITAPGRSIGRFAWIPSRWAPYVGAGGGLMWYRFRQDGDFIDFNTLNVFRDQFDSSGTTPTGHVFGGIEVSLHPRVAVTTEARYQWAKAGLDTDFSGFGPIDLSGLAMTAGISFRY